MWSKENFNTVFDENDHTKRNIKIIIIYIIMRDDQPKNKVMF